MRGFFLVGVGVEMKSLKSNIDFYLVEIWHMSNIQTHLAVSQLIEAETK